MKRLGLLLVVFAWIGVDAAIHQASAAGPLPVTEIALADPMPPVATPAGNHGFKFHHLAGRGGRRCNDPVIAQGSGACSE